MKGSVTGWLTTIIVAACIVPAVHAQLVVSPEEFNQAMKRIGVFMAEVNQSVEAKSYVEAKTPLAISRQFLASTRLWWVKHEEPDGSRMTREAVATLDALDKVLSASVVSGDAVAAAVHDVNRACEACHATYREGDKQSGFRIKVRSGGHQ